MNKLIQFLTILAIGCIAFMSACKDDDSLPQIDGYDSSNGVASANLVAHWPFNGSYNERLSNTDKSDTYGTVGFIKGQIGEALLLAEGAVLFPSIEKINTANALNSFTITMWVNTVGQKGVKDGGFQGFFSLSPTTVTDIWPDLFLGAESGRNLPSSDTLQIKVLRLSHKADGTIDSQDNVAQVNGTGSTATGAWFLGAKKWSLIVATWDPTTHKLNLYGNGSSTQLGAWPDRGTAAELIMAPPLKALFGSLPSTTTGFSSGKAQQTWNPLATASIDDVRLFNKVLTSAEIAALYNLGVAGR